MTETEDFLKTKKTDFYSIDPRLVKVVEGFNTRIDYGDIDELMFSIIENGVRVPLRGYKEGDFYFLTDGHRRLKAVEMAMEGGYDIARIPFITEKKKPIDQRIFDVLLLNDGKQLTSLELGETYKRLILHGYNFTEIAKKIGKTVKHVSDMVSVASSSKDITDAIKDGFISATLVAEVKSKVKDVDKAEQIIKDATAGTDGQKVKVTRKTIEKSLPTILTVTYTNEQVVELLKEQIKACSEKVPENWKNAVLMTEIII